MKSILIPTDFSNGARKAMSLAISIAKKTGSELLFFHTAYFSDAGNERGKTYGEALAMAEKKSVIKLENEVEKVFASLKLNRKKFKVKTLVSFSPSAYDNVLEVIDQKKPSLVVMGTHGATGIRKILFGSVTSHLIAHSKIPVLAVPMNHKLHDLKEIIYSTDLSDSSSELKKINSFNKKLKTKVSVVFADFGWAKSPEENKQLIKLEKTDSFKKIAANLETPFAEYMNKFMKGKNNAVLCMFHERKSGIKDFILGSKTEGLSMALSFPLLSFPKQKI